MQSVGNAGKAFVAYITVVFYAVKARVYVASAVTSIFVLMGFGNIGCLCFRCQVYIARLTKHRCCGRLKQCFSTLQRSRYTYRGLPNMPNIVVVGLVTLVFYAVKARVYIARLAKNWSMWT